MTLLTTTTELAVLCDELAEEPFVALDTEFMGDRTYWPKLGLLQLAGGRRMPRSTRWRQRSIWSRCSSC